ncbi:MAG: GAF domain-containing protein, partial [Anaerolineales bacterium]|nr:GAF domain-containing protein [Anaerolineales bacterium]
MKFIRAIFTPEVVSTHDLHEWRTRILDAVLRGIFALWLIALISSIYNAVEAYEESGYFYQNAWLLAASAIAIYLSTTALLAFITFNRKLKFELRAGLFLFSIYMLGVIGFLFSSFSGDGRILFFAFVILSAIFFDLRTSMAAFVFTALTMMIIGWLQVSETLIVPSEIQINSTDASAWISGGVVLLICSIAALTSITYLLHTLDSSLKETRESLQREQRLSQILRTISEVNQLIIRAKNQDELLQGTCEILISGQGYGFAWISLLESDNLSINLVACAGDTVDPKQFSVRLDKEGQGLVCVKQAIEQKSFFRVTPTENGDPCQACPRKLKHPNRSAISLPILRGDRVLGALVVNHNQPPAVFDEQEIHLLQELTDDLAYALEKIEMNQRLEEDARYKFLLSEITAIALESTESTFLLQSVADKMLPVFNANACYIVLWDEAQSLPIPAAASGYLKEIFMEMQSAADEIEKAISLFQEGQTLIAEDAQSDSRISSRIAEALSICSIMGLPLMADGRRQGGIFLTYDKPYRFTREEIA